MSLATITLTTDKTLSDVGNYVRKIGQGEAGQKLEVIVTDAYGSGYNLNGKTLEFSENKEGGKIVSDNDLDHFEIKDAEAGRFVYTLASAVYAASGVAWFDITSANGSVIDTTKNFNINVIEDESIHINNDNYVSSLAAFETHYDGVIKKAKEDSETLLTKINEQLSQALTDNNQKVANSLADQKAQLQKLIDSTNQLQTDWSVQFTKQKQSLSDVAASWQTQFKKIQDDANSKIAGIESNADTQKVAIQKAADDQLKANKNANDAEIADVKKQLADELAKVKTEKQSAIQDITNARDKAISDATDKLAAKLQSVQGDYDRWKASTINDFQGKLDKLTQQLNTDEADQARLKQAIDSAEEAISKIKDVDFTQYAHKDEVNALMGQKITFIKCDSPQAAADASSKPASDGSIMLGIYDMNNEPSQAIVGDQKINIEWLYNHLTGLQSQVSGLSGLQKAKPDLSGYETNTAAETLADRITTLETKKPNDFYSMVPDGAQTHNNVFRGSNLGALNSTHIANIQNGNFHDMFIGDYFSINGSNYVIAGINTKHLHGDSAPLGNHLLLMPDRYSKLADGTVMKGDGKTTHYMNDTDTTAGGFANTKLYKTYMPSIQRKLEVDFGSHLLVFRDVVSTHVDSNGNPDQGEWRNAELAIPNEVMIYGTTLNGNNQNGSTYNIGDDDVQLPLFRLNPDELTNHSDSSFWLRDICSASAFANANSYGDASWNTASNAGDSVRAFFLIG